MMIMNQNKDYKPVDRNILNSILSNITEERDEVLYKLAGGVDKPDNDEDKDDISLD